MERSFHFNWMFDKLPHCPSIIQSISYCSAEGLMLLEILPRRDSKRHQDGITAVGPT